MLFEHEEIGEVMKKFSLVVLSLSAVAFMSACAPQRPDLSPEVEALKTKVKDLEDYHQTVKALLTENQTQISSLQTEIKDLKSAKTTSRQQAKAKRGSSRVTVKTKTR